MQNNDFIFVSEEKCKEIQSNLNCKIATNNSFDLDDLHYIAGVDLAYWKEDVEKAVCCIVVLDYTTGEIVEEVHSVGEINFPYIPGYLAFRELPLVMECMHLFFLISQQLALQKVIIRLKILILSCQKMKKGHLQI